MSTVITRLTVLLLVVLYLTVPWHRHSFHSMDIVMLSSSLYQSQVFSHLYRDILEIQWNLSNPTHQGTREMCQIVQDVGILRLYFS